MITRRQARVLALSRSASTNKNPSAAHAVASPLASASSSSPFEEPVRRSRRLGRDGLDSKVSVSETQSPSPVLTLSDTVDRPRHARRQPVLENRTLAVILYWTSLGSTDGPPRKDVLRDGCDGAFSSSIPVNSTRAVKEGAARHSLRPTPNAPHHDGASMLVRAPAVIQRVFSRDFADTMKRRDSWKCVVRDVTTLQRARPRAMALTDAVDSSGNPITGRRMLALKPSAAVATDDPAYWTVLRSALYRQSELRRTQAVLTTELHHHMYLRAHEQRMQLLFRADDDAEGGEDAYRKCLDPQRSAKDAQVLQIISAVDMQLNKQFASVYQLPLRPCDETQAVSAQLPTAASRHHASPFAVDGDDRGDSSKSTDTLPLRRLNMVNACIMESLRLVPAYRQLMPYQQEGVRWLLQLNFIERINGILADDMGLGKTAQTVLYLSCYKALVEQVVDQRVSGMRQCLSERYQVGSGMASPSPSDDTPILLRPVTDMRQWQLGSIFSIRASEEPCEDEKASLLEGVSTFEDVQRWIWHYDDTPRVAVHQDQQTLYSERVWASQKRGRPLTSADRPTVSVGSVVLTPQRMRPVLIVAPLSTLPHWRAEFEHFSALSRFAVYVLNGTREERDAMVDLFLRHADHTPTNPGDALAGRRKALSSASAARASPPVPQHLTPVLVIPHDLLSRPLLGVQRRIPHVEWHVVVVDEAHRIKNTCGVLFQKLSKLRSVSRLVLTGTPLQNNITELFALLQFLAPHTFRGEEHKGLMAQLDMVLQEASRSSALEDKELHILLCRRVHRLLAPFLLRRDVSVLRSVLPPKKDFVILCPLTVYQRLKIQEVREKHQMGYLRGTPHIQIRKILLHPYTLLPSFYVDEGVTRTSGKILVLDFMMQFLRRTGHKFLVFCNWTLVLDVVETLCGMRGMPYVRLDGRTSAEKREEHIRLFNQSNATAATPTGHTRQDEEGPCGFLISKIAGGVGLNLQSADTVFLLDVDYNPQRDHQALSRVYRVGQSREVRVFRLIIDHPVERGAIQINQTKETLDEAIVRAGKYDLHSSAQERETELQRVFHRRGDGQSLWASLSNSNYSELLPGAPTSTLPCMAEDVSAEQSGSPHRHVPGEPSGTDAPVSQSAVDPTTAGLHPASYLVEMRERLREVLVRNESEEHVLTDMLNTQVTVLRQQCGGDGGSAHISGIATICADSCVP